MPLPVAWVLSEHPSTHYGFMGELYADLVERLSAQVPVWSISWNPDWPAGATGYHLHLWNAHGRHVGFWGPWKLSQIARTIENLWKGEGFRPQVVQVAQQRWARRLAARWRHSFGSLLSGPLPNLPTGALLPLPTTGIPQLNQPNPKVVTLFTAEDAAEEAAYTAEILALAGYLIHVVGYPRSITPLRSAASRFPGRIDLAVGLSIREAELYAQASAALVQVGKGEVALLQWGRPWFCPAGHKFAFTPAGIYSDAADLPTQLATAAPLPPLSPEAFIEQLLAAYSSTAKAN